MEHVPRSTIHAIFKEAGVRQWEWYVRVVEYLATQVPDADETGECQRLYDLWVAAEEEDRLATQDLSLPSQIVTEDQQQDAVEPDLLATFEALDTLLNEREKLGLPELSALLDWTNPELAEALKQFNNPSMDFGVWIKAAIKVLKWLDEETLEDGSPTQYANTLASLEAFDRMVNEENPKLSAAEVAAILDLVHPESAGLMRTFADDTVPVEVRVRAGRDLLRWRHAPNRATRQVDES